MNDDLRLAQEIDDARERIAAERDQLAEDNAALRAQLAAYRCYRGGAIHHVNGDVHDNRPENLRVFDMRANAPRSKRNT